MQAPDTAAAAPSRSLAELATELGSISAQEWLVGLGVAVAVGVVCRLVLGVLIRRFRRLAQRSHTDVDDLIVELLNRTRRLFVLMLSLWVGAKFIDLPEAVAGALASLLYIGLFVQLGIWANGFVTQGLAKYRRQQLEQDPTAATALGALGFVAKGAVWVVVGLLIIDNLGFDVTALVTGLGIGGIAVALAVQNVLGDLFASLAIVLDKPFSVGDFIVVDSLSGDVEHVGVKTTRVRSISGEQIVFGNANLLNKSIRNYGRLEERRIAFTIGVEYGTPTEKLRKIPEIIQKAVEAQEQTRFSRSHLKQFGDSAIEFETVYFVPVPEYAVYMDVQQGINLSLYDTFAREQIEIAFPSRTVYLRNADDNAGSASNAG